MEVTCPNCGAPNGVDALGDEVVCGSCFHAWVATGDAPVAEPEPEVTFEFDLDSGDGDRDVSSEDAYPSHAPSSKGAARRSGDADDEVFELGDDDIQLLTDGESSFDGSGGGEEDFEVSFESDDEEPTGDLDTNLMSKPSTDADPSSETEVGGTSSFLFSRRRHQKKLNETDVAMIGTYQRRSAEVPQAQDVVWTGPEGAQRAAESRAARPQGGRKASIDPFGSTEVISVEKASETAAWGTGTTSSGSTEAFGGAPSARAGAKAPSPAAQSWDAPPGSVDAFDDDPFGDIGPASRPEPLPSPSAPAPNSTFAFGQAPSAADDDPFADISADSGALVDDPFSSDPFQVSSSHVGPAPGVKAPSAVSGDPFGSAAFTSADGGAAGGLEELDFSALGDDAPEPIPRASGGLPEGRAYSDGFMGTEDSPTRLSDPSLFELDVSDGGEAHAAAGGAPGGGGKANEAARAAARRRRQKGAKGRKQKGKSSRRGLYMVLGLVGLGVGLGQTDLGYFGTNLLFGDGPSPPPQPTEVRAVDRHGAQAGASAAVSAMKGDAPSDYTKRITELEQKIAKEPQKANAEVREELVRTLMRLQERYPAVYKANSRYAESLKKLLSPQDLQSNKQLLIQKLLAEGKTKDAAEALEVFQAEQARDPDVLYLMARVAKSQEQTDRALGYYKRAIEMSPDYEPALYDLGEILLSQQDMVGARLQFEQLLKGNPSHSGAKLAMAQISLYEKNHEEAKRFIEESLTLAKDSQNSDQTYRAYWLKAMLSEAEGKPEEKRIALERALEIRPKDEKTALALADLMIRQDRVIEALRTLKQCQQNGCGSAAFFKALVEAYKRNGQTEDAQSQLNEALRNHPNDTGLLMIHAENEKAAEHFKTAKAIYATVIENDPGYIDAYLALSDLQLREGRQSEALETLRSGVDRVDEKLPILEKLAEIQMKVGATLKAKETMGEILKVDPNNTDVKLRFARVLRGLGFLDEANRYYADLRVAGALQGDDLLDYADVLYKSRKYDEAMSQVDSVLSTDPLNLRANVLSGAVHSAKGDFKRADEDLRRALKVNPESAGAFYFLGRNEMAQGRMASAVEYLSKASSLDSENLDVRYHLALALTEVGGVDNLRMALAQYSFIVTEYEKYTSNLEKKKIDPEVYLRRGRLYFDNGQFKEALSDFKQAMLLDPVRQDLVIEFAKTLQTMGKRKEAETYLEEVLSRDPTNPAAHYHLGIIGLKAGDRNDAEDHFKRAIAAGGANFPVAHRYLGFLYKEKGLTALACNAFKEYLRVAPKNAYDREEVGQLVQRTCH